jgi:hypothetical protein
MHDNVRLFQLNVFRQLVSQFEHSLVRGPDRYATVSIKFDETRMQVRYTLDEPFGFDTYLQKYNLSPQSLCRYRLCFAAPKSARFVTWGAFEGGPS